MTPIERALEIALDVHAGPTDKAGEPYIHHPLRVMNVVEGSEAELTDLLHDVVEDSDYGFDDLRGTGIPDEVVVGIRHLTKREGNRTRRSSGEPWNVRSPER